MDKKLKICFLTGGKYPVPSEKGGAAERFVEQIAAEGSELAELHIISAHSEDAEEKSKAYEKAVFHYINLPENSVKAYKRIKKFCRRAIGQTPLVFDPYLRRALKIINRERFDWVVSENAIAYINPLKNKTSSRVAFHAHTACRLLTPFDPGTRMTGADIVICASNFISDGIKRAGFKGERVTVRDGSDTEIFKSGGEQREEIREKLGISSDDFVAVYSGKFIPEKGIMKLINAMELINDEKVKLLVVGGISFREIKSNEFEKKLLKRAESFGKRIIFTGRTERDKLPLYYHCADVAVFPSLWDESSGTAVIEAMSSGLPVVTSDSGGMAEFAKMGGSVSVRRDDNFTMNLARVIKDLKDDEEKRKEMRKTAVETAEKISQGNNGRKIIELLRDF